ncbi:HET-domain-containing protein [Stipitochalara longipes BDJ]|nr:HET-domain-containing protein [Stipitochalara longipes BDJ]
MVYESLPYCLPDVIHLDGLSLFGVESGDLSAGHLIGVRNSYGKQISGVEYLSPLGKSLIAWCDFNSDGPFQVFDTGSTETFSRIHSWLTTCSSDQHARCSKGEPTSLPKRVLDVSSETVRLYETRGELAKYACLSHCWGKQQIITTTKANISQNLQAISWDALSRTFQDAVTCARRLGLKYLWIDSLCIVQDMRSDWVDPSPLMADYYSKAYITIAATASVDSAGGLFRKWPQFEFTGITTEGLPSQVIVRRMPEHLFESFVLDLFPLLSRAWVYQERLLSTAVLHFGPQELSWECKETSICECGFASAHKPISQQRVMLGRKIKPSELLLNCVGDTEALCRSSLWHRMVSDFAGLELTKYSDRLPAIAGLAKILKPFKKSSPPLPLYAYGIWADSAIVDLCWYTGRPDRHDKLELPSWSWAAVSMGVGYNQFDEGAATQYIHAKVISIDGNHPENQENWIPSKGFGELVIEGKLAEFKITNHNYTPSDLTVECNGIQPRSMHFDRPVSAV